MPEKPGSPSQGGTTEAKVNEAKQNIQEPSLGDRVKSAAIAGYEAAKGAAGSAASAVGGVINKYGGKASSLLEEQTKDLRQIASGDQKANFSVVEIGKPFMFNSNVDPQNRTYNFLATRMNIVDIYPCNYAMSYLYNNDKKKSLFKYGVGYDLAMKTYGKMCTNYLGDVAPPGAVRLYLTDDTTSTDGISTSFESNVFQAAADKLSNLARGITNTVASLSSTAMQEAVGKVMSKADEELPTNIQSPTTGGSDFLGTVMDGLKQVGSVILRGNKFSLPKIWSGSNYKPNFSVSTKLFSPYGSPKAVKEYIIKPLVYLLLLASPQSDDMVSYGKPFAVTVRSWGTGFLTLAGISSLTLQRGGNDTVYNIYKQPLIINVNMNFESLTDGLLAFSSQRDKVPMPSYEKGSFNTIDQILPIGTSENIDGSLLDTVVPTVGGIIRSLQPVNIANLTTPYNENKDTRENVMIGGNGNAGGLGGIGGSLMSGFNAFLGMASSSAKDQAGFGTSLLGGIGSFLGSTAAGVGACVQSLNNTIGTATQLANLVTLGAYSQTPLAKTIGSYQSSIAGGVQVLGACATVVNGVASGLNTVQKTVGSLFNSKTKSSESTPPSKPEDKK